MKPADLDLLLHAERRRQNLFLIVPFSEQPVTELGRRAGLALLCGLDAHVRVTFLMDCPPFRFESGHPC